METTVQGEPIELLTIGLTIAETGRYSVSYSVDAEPETVRDWLDSDVSDSAVKAVNKFLNAEDPERLAKAVQMLDLPRESVGEAMEVADQKVQVLEGDSGRPGSFTYTYIPQLIEDVGDATIYMCKSVNGDKAMMAWDLDDDNAVVKVDEYEDFEVLGWEKLKDFPHGERQIREQYGDRLSDDVLKALVGDTGNSQTSSKAGRTKPSQERLTISTGPKHHQRFKQAASQVRQDLVQEGHLDRQVQRLVLFPTGTERNLSDNWWIAGSYGDDSSVGIANCNKSTYEYLADLDSVYHAEDYIEAAHEYEVVTSDGKQTLGELDDYVVYTTSDESYPRITQPTVLKHLPRLLTEMCEGKWKAPDLDGTETVVVIGQSDAFNARPILKDSDRVLYTDWEVRDIGESSYNVGHEYLLYAKARLGEWDWDSPEMEALEEQCWNLEMDNGGYELVETLALLHDRGEPLYSETPQGRWS